MKKFVNFRWGFDGSFQEMLVDKGRVLARGEDLSGGGSVIDLAGAFLLPAFIDSHCHILPTGLDLADLHLGHCQTREDVLVALQQREKSLKPGEWLMAVHYDQTKYSDARHLTRHELDAAVGGRPCLLRHSNGHAGVANSAALKAAGIDESTPDPRGGTFVREEGGGLTGVLLETALERVEDSTPKPSVEEMTQAILAAGERMASLGIACASDMMTGFLDLEEELTAYRQALERGCPVRIRLYLQWSCVFGKRAVPKEALEDFEHRVPADRGKIAGIKIFADGAIGSATAAIYGAFETTGGDGQLIYAPGRLKEMVRVADEAGYSISIHSIGDRSTDLVMDAFEACADPTKHRIEHVMILSNAQIARLRRLGCHATMQPEFLLRFPHSYKRQLPESTFRMLERFRSVHEAGIPLSLSSDRPIVPGDPWDGILTAEKRPEGFDPSENLPRKDGFLAYTAEASAVNGDGRSQGTLEPGSVADFCVYDEDPFAPGKPKVQRLYVGGEPV